MSDIFNIVIAVCLFPVCLIFALNIVMIVLAIYFDVSNDIERSRQNGNRNNNKRRR